MYALAADMPTTKVSSHLDLELKKPYLKVPFRLGISLGVQVEIEIGLTNLWRTTTGKANLLPAVPYPTGNALEVCSDKYMCSCLHWGHLLDIFVSLGAAEWKPHGSFPEMATVFRVAKG